MSKYRITSPDGKAFIVTAPDGATQDQVLEYAKSQWEKSAAAPEMRAPAEDPGMADAALIGAGRTFDRIIKGLQQTYYGATKQEDKQLALKAQAESDDAAYAGLQKLRPFATGIGESVPSMVIPAGGAATLVGNVGRMALAGGVPAALEYGTVQDRMRRGLVGAGSAAVVPLAGAAIKTTKALVEPLYAKGREAIAGRTLARVAGEDAANVIPRLEQANPLVPGSLPTVGQVADNGGLAALERAASAANPTDYTTRAMEQASARLGALRGLAGDESKMAAAVAAREAAAKPLYAQADAGVAPIDGFFRGLEMRPQFKAAVNRAQELAKNKGLADIFFRDADGKPIALIGEGAHLIKKALDEAGEYGSTSYTSREAAKAAGKTNEVFQNWLSKTIPEYAAGKAAFEAGSVPVNRMAVGQALLEKAQPALADYGALAKETGAGFANALRHGDQVAANAVGFPGATMKDILAPDQFALVENIARDLARKSNAQDLGRGVGSDTFQKLAMQNIAQQSGMPRLTGGLLELPGVSRATSWIYRDADQKMQKTISDALLDPKKAATLMADVNNTVLKNNPKLRQLLEQVVIRGGGLLAGATVANP